MGCGLFSIIVLRFNFFKHYLFRVIAVYTELLHNQFIVHLGLLSFIFKIVLTIIPLFLDDFYLRYLFSRTHQSSFLSPFLETSTSPTKLSTLDICSGGLLLSGWPPEASSSHSPLRFLLCFAIFRSFVDMRDILGEAPPRVVFIRSGGCKSKVGGSFLEWLWWWIGVSSSAFSS